MILTEDITGLILAGGRGMRMGQKNKGLQSLNAEPMIMHVLRRISPQVGSTIINANQDIPEYKKFNTPVFSDVFTGYAGPLAGIHCGLKNCKTNYLVSVPCDSPFLPLDLVGRLSTALAENDAQIAVVNTVIKDGDGDSHSQQPVFSLLRSDLVNHLEDFLQTGGRKVSAWYKSLRVIEVTFEDLESFRNINTLAELQQYADQP
jgi:molybdopterin-guanine dinucleotide biosynthesis protein A